MLSERLKVENPWVLTRAKLYLYGHVSLGFCLGTDANEFGLVDGHVCFLQPTILMALVLEIWLERLSMNKLSRFKVILNYNQLSRSSGCNWIVTQLPINLSITWMAEIVQWSQEVEPSLDLLLSGSLAEAIYKHAYSHYRNYYTPKLLY